MKVINIMVIEILQKRSNCDISLLGGSSDTQRSARKVSVARPAVNFQAAHEERSQTIRKSTRRDRPVRTNAIMRKQVQSIALDTARRPQVRHSKTPVAPNESNIPEVEVSNITSLIP